mmetsp:Transcript_9799/g.18162  ORF Transcript_9799/g.18162 Transcript_9799/m.18162 type:complete len:83 (+) Transcript_9799:186-434(+)
MQLRWLLKMVALLRTTQVLAELVPELVSELALEPSCLLLQDYKRHNTLPEGQLLISRCSELDPDRSCSQTPTKNGKNGLPGP